MQEQKKSGMHSASPICASTMFEEAYLFFFAFAFFFAGILFSSQYR